LLASGWTLLRQVRRRIRAIPIPAPRVLGVDDWAWKKGHQYGTILCDLEAGKVVDLLPDRKSGRMVGRESRRGNRQPRPGQRYAEAMRRAIPQAVQIADRWHLLRNLSEALRNALQPYHRTLTKPPGRVEALNS
jgi:transposase